MFDFFVSKTKKRSNFSSFWEQTGPGGFSSTGRFWFLLTLDCVDHVGLQRRGQDGTREVLQEPDHPVAQRGDVQLLQIWKQTHLSLTYKDRLPSEPRQDAVRTLTGVGQVSGVQNSSTHAAVKPGTVQTCTEKKSFNHWIRSSVIRLKYGSFQNQTINNTSVTRPVSHRTSW